MKPMKSDWYKKIWTLDIQNQSWVEDTKRQVDFLVEKLKLKGNERILDLACGFGRHSLELARRGFEVTGVDITSDYIGYAAQAAEKAKLNARFICSDIRDVGFETSSEHGIYATSGIPMNEPRCMMCMETYKGSLENISGYVVYDMYYNA